MYIVNKFFIRLGNDFLLDEDTRVPLNFYTKEKAMEYKIQHFGVDTEHYIIRGKLIAQTRNEYRNKTAMINGE